jgi:hypothetical protein
VFGSGQFFDLGILGNQRWIRGLSIEEADELLDALRLAGVAAVEQDLCFTGSPGFLPATRRSIPWN